jgi:large conductance mechanosensitive channel
MNPLDRIAAAEPMKRVGNLYEQFRAFAFKGNVVDLAVGVIIGAAFGKIVDSLVKNIFMPLIAAIPSGNINYKDWVIPVGAQNVQIGLFLSDVLNFLLIALVLFLVVRKFLGWVMRARTEETAAAPVLTKDQELLTEIRDLLRNQSAAPLPPPADRPV